MLNENWIKHLAGVLEKAGLVEDRKVALKVLQYIKAEQVSRLECNECGSVLPDSYFFKNGSSSRRGRNSFCKSCYKEKYRQTKASE